MVSCFPFVLTECSGITLDLNRDILIDSSKGCNSEAIAKKIRSKYTAKYHDKMDQYYKNYEFKKPIFSRMSKPQVMGGFSDPMGNYGRVPSGIQVDLANYIESLIEKHVAKYQTFYNYEVQRRWGSIYKMDHCFKPPKHMYKVDGSPIVSALFTVMNEYGEIRVNSFTHGQWS